MNKYIGMLVLCTFITFYTYAYVLRHHKHTVTVFSVLCPCLLWINQNGLGLGSLELYHINQNLKYILPRFIYMVYIFYTYLRNIMHSNFKSRFSDKEFKKLLFNLTALLIWFFYLLSHRCGAELRIMCIYVNKPERIVGILFKINESYF